MTATIIDHAEYDRRLLAEAAARRGAPLMLRDTDHKAAYLSSHIARRPPIADSAPVTSQHTVSPHKLRASFAEAQRELEAKMDTYLARARRAETTGRLGAARCSYDVVLRRGNEQQRLQAQAGLAALAAARKTVPLASRE